MKNLFLLLSLIVFTLHLNVSCTSSADSEAQDELAAEDQVSEDGSEEEASEDVAEEDSGEASEEVAEEAGDEEVSEDAGEELADEGTTEEATTENAATEVKEGEDDFAIDEGEESQKMDQAATDVPASENAPADAVSSEAVTTDAVAATPTETTDASGFGQGSDANAGYVDASTGEAASTEVADAVVTEEASDVVAEAPARTWVPVKKVKDVPFRQAGQLLNTVYIVRPGDSLSSASTKLFGTDKSSDILAANPHLNKSFKTGDKLYYNSPNRPDDAAQMLSYYQDNGMAPSTYTAQEGDDLRAVSQQLLGDSETWKEIYALNPSLESKGSLSAGTSFNYFAGAAPAVAQVNAPSNFGSAPQDLNPPPQDFAAPQAALAPPAPETFNQAQNMPTQNPDAMMAAGTVGQEMAPPPPAPPTMEMAPPPPPPEPMARKRATVDMSDETAQDANMTMMLGVALLVVAGGLFMIIRKNKAKKFNMGETQV